MSTPLDITALTAAAGSKVVAAVYLPAGLTTAAGTTVAGGTVTGTTTVPTAASVIYVGLTESPAQAYSALGVVVAGTVLPDGGPYRAEARTVDAATDMTSYAAIGTAFAAATAAGSLVAPRQNYADNGGAFLVGGAWAQRVDVVSHLGTPQTAGRDLGSVLPSVAAGSLSGGLPICHSGTAGEPVVYSDLASIHRTDGGQESANNLYDYWAANGPYAAFAPVRQGTCQASGNTTTAVKLDAGASGTNGTRLYVGHVLTFDSGTGAGQAAVITDYSGTTKIATVAPAVTTAADGTTRFSILRNLAAALDASLRPGVDWSNVGAPTSFVNLTGTSIATVIGSVGSVATAAPVYSSYGASYASSDVE